jgi:hypothetical protein
MWFGELMKKRGLGDQDRLHRELFEALAYFWAREQLVLHAIVGLGVSLQELPKGISAWYEKTPQSGMWGNEWEFMFHGGGCLITHIHTGEPIDWNGPNPEGLDTLSFIPHLEWRLAQGHTLPFLRQYLSEHNTFDVLTLIDDLIADGVITEDYRLTPHVDAPHASAA